MAEIDKQAKPTKLLWVDLEMTGLDPQEHVIVEVAAQVTDFNFTVLDEYQAVIWQSDEVLDRSNPWAKQQHTTSGLLARIRTDGLPESDVINEFASFITANFGDEPAVLAGNSIHSDRSFIKRWWPQVEDLLHYRMLDVTGLKILMQGKYDVAYDKPEVHRAMNDIQASIAELEFYLAWLQKEK